MAIDGHEGFGGEGLSADLTHLGLRLEAKLRAHPVMHCRFHREIASLLGCGEDIFGRGWPWCRCDLSELTILAVLLLLLLGKPLRGELNIIRGLLVDIVRLGRDAAR